MLDEYNNLLYYVCIETTRKEFNMPLAKFRFLQYGDKIVATSRFVLVVDKKDEVAVKFDLDTKEFVILVKDFTSIDEVLHEDGTYRVPHPHALAKAWGVARAMNWRLFEAQRQRK